MAIVIAMLVARPPLVVLLGPSVRIVLSLSTRSSSPASNLDGIVHTIPFAAIIVALILFARRAYLRRRSRCLRPRRALKGEPMRDPDFTSLRRPGRRRRRGARCARLADLYHYDPSFIERFRRTERKVAELFLTTTTSLLMQAKRCSAWRLPRAGSFGPEHRR
jgi:hypothetical protein